MPNVVTFEDGSTITYSYAADGTKLRTVHSINGATAQKDYCGSVIYENGAAKLWQTEAGYISMNDSKYHYYLQDHQGNNRVVVSDTGATEEVNHYYAFGGLFDNSNSVQPFKYNGKELDTQKGLNWYDYGARQYDAALGRWFAVDPLAEKYFNLSPYTYCNNLPIRYIDPTGKDWKDAWPIFKGSISAKLTSGLRVAGEIENTGFDFNFGSITLGSIGYNDNAEGVEMVKAFSLGTSIIGVNMGQRVYETNGRNVVKETKCGIDLLSSISLDIGKESIYTPYKNTYENAESQVIGGVDFKTGISIAALMGIDIEINWSQVLDAIITLFK